MPPVKTNPAPPDTAAVLVEALDGVDTHVEPLPQLTLNSGAVPGGTGTIPRNQPIKLHGVVWEPEHAGPLASPIGYRLAAEMVPE